MNSDIEQAYIDNCNRFKAVCDKFLMFLEYVETTISSLAKEKVGKFWVNQVMHMRNTTTNIAEFAHSRLKKYLTSSMSNLSTNWKSVHNMLELQYTQIHTSF